MSSEVPPPASPADNQEDNCQHDQGSSPKADEGQEQESLADFPTDKDNPFETAVCGSDVVLIVEGKKLHAHRQILSVYSQYFRLLLGSPHFAEANASEIELKGNKFVEVKHDAMVKFLSHLYPMLAFTRIQDDKTLEDLFPLADYFQCQYIRIKCESYMGERLDGVKEDLPTESTLLYLRFCEKYGVKKLIYRLLQILSVRKLGAIVTVEHWKWLTPELQRDVFQERASSLEKKLDRQVTLLNQCLCRKTLVKTECVNCREYNQHAYVVCGDCAYKLDQNLRSGL